MSTTTPRTYGQNCGLARSLDLLGERWTALIIRELARGPKRFGDLEAGLQGIGTNLLAARLKRLEADGIVERITLPAPASVAAYALAQRGRALEPIFEDLAIWGVDLIYADPDPTFRTKAAWAAMSMRARMSRDGTAPPDGLYGFAVGDERFWLRVAGPDSELRDGPPPVPADLAITTDLQTFMQLATGGATADADVETEGDRRRLAPLFAAFRMPEGSVHGA